MKVQELCPDCGNGGYYSEKHEKGIFNFCEECGWSWRGTKEQLKRYLQRVGEEAAK